jgi:hypothetical protein
MKEIYTLKISTKDSAQTELINQILGVESNSDFPYNWEYIIERNEDEPYVDFMSIYYSILDGKLKDLLSVGIEIDDISIWYLYEYDYQCNMEFTPQQLSLLSKLGVTLCISCWDGGDYTFIPQDSEHE